MLCVEIFLLHFFVYVHVFAFVYVGDVGTSVYGTGVEVKGQPWLLVLNCLLTSVWPAAFPHGRLAGFRAPRNPPVSTSPLTISWINCILHGLGIQYSLLTLISSDSVFIFS